MKYRSRMDIIAAILEITTVGALKTRIMYSASLSFEQMQEYMGLSIAQGLIEQSDDKLYRITEKGLQVLKMYREIDRMIPQQNSLTVVKK